MRIVKAGFERITEKDPIKKIEQVARVCYKSEDKICEGSAEKMVRALVKSKHYAMLEHGSIILKVDTIAYSQIMGNAEILKAEFGWDVMLRNTFYDRGVISGNFRAWLEYMQGCLKYNLVVPHILVSILLKYNPIFEENTYDSVKMEKNGAFTVVSPEELTDAERLVHEDVTIKWVCDRGVSHEIVRHRKASYAQESTRYCNYGISGEVTFIKPCFIADSSVRYNIWEESCKQSEINYHTLITLGAKPQEARDVLTTSVKTEVVMTANLNEWIHFFRLRALGTTGNPHPQMLEIAIPAMYQMVSEFPFISEKFEEDEE